MRLLLCVPECFRYTLKLEMNMQPKNKSKQAAYSFIALVYVFTIAMYGTAPLVNLLSGLPKEMATVAFYIIVMLPLILLVGLSMRLSNKNEKG